MGALFTDNESRLGVRDEIWTRDLLHGKQTFYHWTTHTFAMLLMNPPRCQGLLLTARDLVFGVIDFRLYYASLIQLYILYVGAPSRIWTDDLLITNQLLYRWAIRAGEREFFRLFLAATKWLVKMLDHLLSATSETHYLFLRIVLC